MSLESKLEHQGGKQHGEALASAIPAPDDGSHAKSAAAHLGGGEHEHTHRLGTLKHGINAGELKEPPMVIQKAGKQHK